MPKSVYTIQQINAYIGNMFEQDYLLQKVCVKGEISNCKYHSSGHIYFTLKDQMSSLACVMFAGNRKGLTFALQEGMQVQVDGSIEVYVRDGKYQLYAKNIVKDGMGSLYEQFEALKRKLAQEGLFDDEYKRPIPKYINSIGVVTASTGAAVRDIITVSKRRNPFIQIVVYPAIVQGEAAADSIVKGIHALEQYGVDCMIVGRGGGSIEDLWAFNEESVAQAIFQSEIPVISAVGHEVDYTIADFVADVRAATPSAAAEIAVCELREIENDIEEYRKDLLNTMQGTLQNYKGVLQHKSLRMQALKPHNIIKAQRVFTMNMEERMVKQMERLLEQRKAQMQLYVHRLNDLSPLQRLSSGYAYVADANGHTISDVHDVNVNDALVIHLKNGRVRAKATKIEEEIRTEV